MNIILYSRFIDMAKNHRFFEDVEDIDGKELRAKLSQLNQVCTTFYL